MLLEWTLEVLLEHVWPAWVCLWYKQCIDAGAWKAKQSCEKLLVHGSRVEPCVTAIDCILHSKLMQQAAALIVSWCSRCQPPCYCHNPVWVATGILRDSVEIVFGVQGSCTFATRQQPDRQTEIQRQ